MTTSKYDIVEKDYDSVSQSFHNSYDSTKEFSSQIQHFIYALPTSAHILNIGGTVAECGYFIDQGFKVTNIDVSQRMLNIIKNEFPEVSVIKENVKNFAGHTFDGIWACRSLIHIPPEDIDTTLENIYTLTKPDGVFSSINFISDKVYVEEEFPEEHTDKEGVLYYRVLWNTQVLEEKISQAGFKVSLTEDIKDSDNDEAVYIQAVREG